MSEFKQHWTLDPSVTFLNHGSFGACPRAVIEAQTEFRAQLEREPVRFMVDELPGHWHRALESLGKFVDADPEDLSFVTNATTAVNAVLRSLDLSPGDELLCTNHEYNACANVLAFVAKRFGATFKVVDIPFPIESKEQVTEAVLSAVTPKTKLVLLDHVTSPTALILPLEDIIPALKEKGILTLIDGAHAVGMLPLSMRELGCDFYTSNAHKWLCAPKGAAFLWVDKKHQDWVRPAVISHGANAPTEKQSRYRWEFDWQGTSDPTPWISIPAAIEYMGSLFDGGWDALRERNNSLARAGRDLILQALGQDPAAPDDMLACMATIPIGAPAPRGLEDHFDILPLQAWLRDEKKIQVPMHPFPAPPNQWVRISAQVYNSIEDYRYLADSITEYLKR